MPFLFAAGVAVLLEVLGPIAAIAIVAWRSRPRASAGVWAAGLAAVPIGAILFLTVLVARGVIGVFVPGLSARPDPGWGPLVVHGLVAGFFVAVMEEGVRFAAAAALFRRASGRPLIAGALFGLGWGAVEVLLVLRQQIQIYSFRLRLYGSADAVPLPFASLLIPAERLGAMLLHVALSGLAVAAAMALSRGPRSRVVALFAFAIAVHGLLDAWVVVMAQRYLSQLDIGNASGIGGTILLEVVFIAGGALTLFVASRLPSATAQRSGGN